MRQRRAGFTLLEVTIVVLVAGLLIGAVIGGVATVQEMKFTAMRRDVDGAIAAFLTYRERFNFMPGDDPRATRWPGATPGDGNGDYVTLAGEAAEGLNHLRLSGLISEEGLKREVTSPGVVFLDLPYGTRGRFSERPADPTGNGWDDMGNPAVVRRVLIVEDVTPEVARRIEEDWDDGQFANGPIQESADPNTAAAPVDVFFSFQ